MFDIKWEDGKLSRVNIGKLAPVGDDFGEQLCPGTEVVAKYGGSRYRAVIQSLEDTTAMKDKVSCLLSIHHASDTRELA